MKKLLITGLVTLALSGVSPAGIAGNKAAASISCGTTYSVAAEGGSLLLQHHGKFSMLYVGFSARIRDGKGQRLTLEDIRPGDWIQYWTDPAGGPALISNISVNSGERGYCSSAPVLGLR